MSIKPLATVTGLVVLLLSTAGQATSVVAMNLDELTQRSDAIVIGTAKNVTYGMHPTAGYPVTKTTFKVDETLYGDESVQERTVSVVGGPAGNGLVTVVPGMPRFKVDEKAVLFLVTDPATGNAVPTGLQQGVFRIKVDPKTEKEYIVNQSVDLGVTSLNSDAAKARTKKKAENLSLVEFKTLLKKKLKARKKLK